MRYFRGEVEFGTLSQTSHAFHTVLGALTVVLHKLESCSRLDMLLDRVDTLFAELEVEQPDLVTSGRLQLQARGETARGGDG